MPRPPSANSIVRNLKKQSNISESKSPIGTELYLPNHSGDHSAGNVSQTPTNDSSIVNKKYVDDNLHDAVTVTDTSTINLTLLGQDIQAATIDSGIVHDNLNGFVANEHIDWTAATSNFSTTGTGHFTGNLDTDGDFTVDGELKGSKHSILTGEDKGWSVTLGFQKFLTAGGVTMTTTKGLTMIRPGSIVGISINYNITTTTGNPNISIDVLVNGGSVWTNSISSTVANDKESQFTQNRGVDTFSAGDTISIQITNSAALSSATLEKIISMIEFYYDS